VTDHVVRSESEPSERLRRLTFRAWRRGFREADLVLGPFVEREGATLSDADMTAIEALLDEDDDHAIYAWIIESRPTPEEHETPVMARIRAFMRAHVSAEVAKGAG
jgi:antitoxin CptB